MYLANDQLVRVSRILARHVPRDVQVLFFGSRVHGRSLKPRSDLDICLKGPAPLPARVLAELKDAFAESDLPIRVDVVDWWQLSEEFKKAITADLVKFTQHAE